MRRHWFHHSLFLMLLLALSLLGIGLQQHGRISLPNRTKALPGYYPVTHVVDGDTIDVRIAGRSEPIRLIGYDTPEEFDPRAPLQCFAKPAADHMHELLDGKSVRLVGDPEDSDRDKYHRLLRYVYLPNGTLVNQVQVEQGYGFAYVIFPFSKKSQFVAWEAEARQARRGLWAACQVHSEGEKEQTQAIGPAPTPP